MSEVGVDQSEVEPLPGDETAISEPRADHPLNPFMPGQAEPDDEPPLEPGELEHLIERARIADDLLERLAETKFRLEMIESNVDLDCPAGQLFLKAIANSPHWTGTETAAEIRATALHYDVPLRGAK